MTRRRNIRDVQVNRRYGALCARERLRIQRLLQLVMSFAQLAESGALGEEAQRRERHHAALIAAVVCNIWQDRTCLGPSVRQQPPRFSNITENEAWHDFRFRAEDLPRLLRALRIPRRVVLRNGSTFHGETALLLLLRRMRYPGRMQDFQQQFGRDYTQLSRLFNERIDLVWNEHEHRMNDNLDFHARRFDLYRRKIEEKGGLGLVLSYIIGFIDGAIRKMCRPGGDDDLQRECYDGHHKVHGLAWQSVVFADGIIWDVHMETGRRHDSYLLSQSHLNNRLAEVQQGNSVQCKVYGDAAYPIMSHIDRGFRGANLTPAQRAYNKNLSQVRICVEWMFGKVSKEFAFVDYSANLKLRLQPVATYYGVALLLTNAHSCSYGNVTASYFSCMPLSLEEYFQV